MLCFRSIFKNKSVATRLNPPKKKTSLLAINATAVVLSKLLARLLDTNQPAKKIQKNIKIRFREDCKFLNNVAEPRIKTNNATKTLNNKLKLNTPQLCQKIYFISRRLLDLV